MIDSYKQIFSPGNIIVNETMVPWRGRLTFRQYIPTKSHKYDIKLYKLCFTEGYTWSAKVYSRREITGSKQVSMAENVCIELAAELLNEGRALSVNNFYTSYQLAVKFLKFRMHVVGTVRHKQIYAQCIFELSRGDAVVRIRVNGSRKFQLRLE